MMRSLVYTGPGAVSWREAPEPQLQGDREAIVVPVVASRCDYDNLIVRGALPLPAPFALGHEAVVRIVSIGDSVSSLRPGDLAVLVWHISCGVCDRCQRGMTGHCREVPPASSYGIGPKWGGLFDDLVRVPFADAMLTPVPAHVDLREISAAGDGLGLGHGIISRNLALHPQRTAVFGRGEHGLYHVAFAVALGMPYVAYADPNAERQTLASGLGAHAVAASPHELGRHFDLIVDAAGNEEWLYGTVGMLEPEGVIECLGGYFADMRLPGLFSYVNGATVRFGLGNNSLHVQPVLDAVARGTVRPSTLWATEIDWEDLPAAYTDEPRKIIAVRPAAAGIAPS